MSNFIFIKNRNGQLQKLLCSDSGVIQTSFDGETFTDMTGGEATNAATADAPADAAVFTAALNPATVALQGMLSPTDYGFQPRKAAADLTDADVTITPFTSVRSLYRLPAATPLTQNRILTLSTTDLVNGILCTVVVEDTSAFTYTIKTSAGGGTLATHAANSVPIAYQFYSNAGNWILSVAWYCN